MHKGTQQIMWRGRNSSREYSLRGVLCSRSRRPLRNPPFLRSYVSKRSDGFDRLEFSGLAGAPQWPICANRFTALCSQAMPYRRLARARLVSESG